jgi:hypothetical protein
MSSRLAFNPIQISAGDIAIRLRPSLRAGWLIAQQYDLDDLRQKLEECDFGAISYLIAIGCDDITRMSELIAAKTERNGLCLIQDFTPAIVEFVKHSIGWTDDAPEQAAPSSKPFVLTDHLTELFEFAAGVLHWSPADTWAATPAEIDHARNGMLRHLNSADDPRNLPTEAEIDQGLATLRALSGEAA